jgi:lipoyl(octanoyl) transferase|tara:strand:+ start:543 stop:1172 length:630 start_codon:yes stop_codon:yes gene_type:complete
MSIEIKKSIKPIKYKTAIDYLEGRLSNILKHKEKELIWILEHSDVYTAGTSSKDNELLDKNIKLVKTNRGGKITFHGPGQIICYFVIDLRKRKKDIRKFINIIEKTIIESLLEFKIKSFADSKNIGVWIKRNDEIKKIAAIGVRVSKWIAYHGFSINLNNDLKKYEAIIPCGIKDRGITSLQKLKKIDYDKLVNSIIKNFIKNLEDEVV